MRLARKLIGKSNNEKISIYSHAFVIYLVFVLAVWMIEAADVICFTVGIEQLTLVSRIVVLILMLGLLLYVAPNIRMISTRFNGTMVIGVIIILIIGILKSVYPDTSYDTLHYHLINQKTGFVNYFETHFAKGNFQIWGFRLGDRLFYIFRSLLGYRLGTLLNTVVLMVVYIQMNELLKIVNESRVCRAIWALIIVLVHDAVLMIGTYYVDILPLPIAMEVLRKLLEASKQEQNSRDVFYFAFLNGIWFAFKMTNIVFIAPCVLIYIFLSRKQLSFKRFIWAGILAASPCSIYLLYAFQCTGNPIFPYFNTWFKSIYFSNNSFKDVRWGGTNTFEKIFWLIYMIFDPNYRQSEIPNENTLLFGVGLLGILLVVAAVLFGKKIKIEIPEEIVLIVILLLCSAFAWSFSTGYSRYFIFGMLLLGIIACYCLDCLWKGKCKIIVLVVYPILLLQSIATVKEFYSGREWSWTIWTKDTFIEQCSKIFSDKESDIVDLDIDMFYLTNTMYAGIADMANSQTYTFNASYSSYLDNDKLINDKLQKCQELIESNVYDIHKRNLSDIKEYVQNLNAHKMIIEKFEKYDGNMGVYELVKIQYSDVKSNSVYLGEEVENFSIQTMRAEENAALKLVCGRIYDWKDSPKCNMAILINNEELCRIQIDNSLISNYHIDLGSLNQDDVITINLYYENGNIFDDQLNKVFIINPIIE